MNSKKLGLVILVTILFTSISVAMVAAQYTTQKTTDITLDSHGVFLASESSVGVSYTITGAAGATGSVTAAVYDGNPQTTASIPSGVSLTHFVVITFNMSASDFTSAKIVLTYSSSDVQNLNAPYSVYKYDSNSNSYIVLPSTVDTNAKTITVTLSSLNDPLLAIGGSTATGSSGGISTLTWVVLAVAVIIIIIVAVFTVNVLRKPDEKKSLLGKTR